MIIRGEVTIEEINCSGIIFNAPWKERSRRGSWRRRERTLLENGCLETRNCGTNGALTSDPSLQASKQRTDYLASESIAPCVFCIYLNATLLPHNHFISSITIH